MIIFPFNKELKQAIIEQYFKGWISLHNLMGEKSLKTRRVWLKKATAFFVAVAGLRISIFS